MATLECDFDSYVLAAKKSSLLFLILFRCGFRYGKEEYSLWGRIMGRRSMVLLDRIVLTDLALQSGIAFWIGPWIGKGQAISPQVGMDTCFSQYYTRIVARAGLF